MRAKSITGSSPDKIRAALSESMTDGFSPTVAIVFISIKQDRKAVCEILEKERIDILGATSCGEFTNGHHSEGEAAILLLDLSRQHYVIQFLEIGERSVRDAATAFGRTALQEFSNPSLVLCSTGMNKKGDYFDGETLVHSIEDTIGSDRVFYGGMAGDDGTLTGSYVFTKGKETDFGMAALVLNGDKVALQGLAITGWKPMGIARTITKSRGNLVYTIDDKPAAEMYLQYLGKTDHANLGSFNLMKEVSMHYPFIVERPGGGTFLHTPLQIDEKENALQLDIAMPEGTTCWFSMPPDFDIVDEVLVKAARVKKGIQADALLVFSCAGRINVLGPLVHEENEGLHEVWKVPMAGFFTYGEFGRDNRDKQEFHSGACCWVVLKEK